jgi:hypothetical protein
VELAPHGAVTPRAIGVAAFTTGMAPLLGRWIESGALQAPEDVAALLSIPLAHARVRAGRIHDLLVTLAPAAAGAGLRPVVLKGSHTAWRFFPEPGTRPTADVDLLVSPAEGPAMERILRDAGCALVLRQRRPTRSVWRPAGEDGRLRSLELTHAHNPLTVDLHLSLDRGFYGVSRSRLADPGEADLEPVPGLPEAYRGLRGPLLLLSLALHASEDLYNLQLLRLVELVLVSRGAPDPAALWHDTLEVGQRARAMGDAFPAMALLERLDPGAVPPEVVSAARAQAPPALRAVVDGLSPATAQRLEGITLGERLAGARTPADKMRRIAHMLAPDSAAGSWRALLDLYVTRGYQLLGGRVRFGSRVDREG